MKVYISTCQLYFFEHMASIGVAKRVCFALSCFWLSLNWAGGLAHREKWTKKMHQICLRVGWQGTGLARFWGANGFRQIGPPKSIQKIKMALKKNLIRRKNFNTAGKNRMGQNGLEYKQPPGRVG